jgi:uncharacterized protein (DUF2147 family)
MILVTLLLAASTPSAAAGFEGRWHTPGNRSVVEISRCGAQYCGRIVSVVPPARHKYAAARCPKP